MEENQAIPRPCVFTYMSEAIDQIASALSAFQGTVKQPALNKEVKVATKSGQGYKFKYADLSECVKSSAPALKENGLAVTQVIVDGTLVTLLAHKSGQWFQSRLNMPGNVADYQALGSAITYLKRYAYCAILGIVADSDDDANAACGNQAEVAHRNTAAAAFTGAQLQAALSEVEACKSQEDINALWQRYSAAIPSLCKKGAEFYNAVGAKSQSFKK